jgi:hypothetical protein
MQNLTLSELVIELDYQASTGKDLHPLIKQLESMAWQLSDEKEELAKQAELAEECKEALFNIIDQKIIELVSSSVDYNENHIDSHGSYADMVADNYVYNNRQKELISFCAENDIDLSSVDIEQLENKLFDIMQGQAAHQFCSRPYHDKFILGCFAFGEHEIQVEFDQIGDCVTLEIMQHMKDNNLFDAHCGSLDNTSGLFYQSSDNCLEFYVTLDIIKACIATLAE